MPEVRRDLLGIFARMDNQAKRDPLLMEPYHQVHYALVALADEVVLTSGWEHSPAWRQALLEERFYNTQQAGRQFFELANKLENAPQDVVAIFYLCLALGFSGRYAPADHELAEVKERLLVRLPSKPRIMEEQPNARAHKERRMRSWLWSAAAVAVLLAAAVLGWDQWQSPQTPKPDGGPASISQSAPAPKHEAQPKAKPDQIQKAAVPAKILEPSQAGSEPGPPPSPATKADTTKETSSTSQSVRRPAPTPAALPNTKSAPQEPPQAKPAAQEGETPPLEKSVQPAPAVPKSSSAPAKAPKTAAAPVTPTEPAQPDKAQASAPETAPKEKTYRVRVGVYVGPIQSGRFADQLKQAGFPVAIEKLDRPEGKVLYVVSITPLANLAEAERIRSEVKQRFNVTGVIKEN